MIVSLGGTISGMLSIASPNKALAFDNSQSEMQDINTETDDEPNSIYSHSASFDHKVASLSETSRLGLAISIGSYDFATMGNSWIARYKVMTSSGLKNTASPYNSHEKIACTIIEGISETSGLTFQDLDQCSVPTDFYGCYPEVQSILHSPLVSGLLAIAQKAFALLQQKLLKWTLSATKIIYNLVSKSTDYSFNTTSFSRSFFMGRVDENAQFQQANCWFPNTEHGRWDFTFKYTVLLEDEYWAWVSKRLYVWYGAEYKPEEVSLEETRSTANGENALWGCCEAEENSSENLLLELPAEANGSTMREITLNHIERSRAFVKGYTGIEEPTEEESRILDKYVSRLEKLIEFKNSLDKDTNNRYRNSSSEMRNELARIIPEFAK